MIENNIVTALVPTLFAADRFFYLHAPFGTRRPFATFQFVGGRSIATLCGETTRKNYRVQFNVWDEVVGGSAAQSLGLMRQLEAIVTAAPLRGASQGGVQSVYDEVTRSYGARQDFSFWA